MDSPFVFLTWLKLYLLYLNIFKGINEKGSGDVVSAACVQRDRYIVYTASHIAEKTSPEPFS